MKLRKGDKVQVDYRKPGDEWKGTGTYVCRLSAKRAERYGGGSLVEVDIYEPNGAGCIFPAECVKPLEGER